MYKYKRHNIYIYIFGIAFVFVTLRLIHTTLFPQSKILRCNNEHIERGQIFDRHKRLLSGRSRSFSLYVRPKFLSPELSEYIRYSLEKTGFFSEEELSRLEETEKNFVYIKRNMSPIILPPVRLFIQTLKNKNIIKSDLLGILPEESRIYPYPCLSPIIGKSGLEQKGLYGIEYTLNKYLESGHNITLSLDAELCKVVYEELLKVVKSSGAEGGSAAIMDIKSREILALSQFSANSNAPLSISHIYEPGSVMKMFSAAFSLEHGIANLEHPIFDDKSPFKIGKYVFNKPCYGEIPLSTMLIKSANISFARLADLFSEDDFYLWLKNLGFGKKPNLPLSNIEKGILHPTKTWTHLSRIMIAIGQEIGVTTLQLVIAAAVIGGEGQMIDPRIILSIQNQNGTEYYKDTRNSIQLMQKERSQDLLETLENVVQKGTGRRAALKNIRIAGKTGTGQIADPDEGYTEGRNNTVFVGILPVENPNLVMAISIHHPKGRFRSGGGVSAPLFADIIKRILLLLNYADY